VGLSLATIAVRLWWRRRERSSYLHVLGDHRGRNDATSTGLSIERDRVECNKSERHSSTLASFVNEEDDESRYCR
jgi:hypothetical protein